jgi:hypothetical protein
MKKSIVLTTCLGWAVAGIAALVVFALWSELIRSAFDQADPDLNLVMVILGIEVAFTVCGLISGLIIPGQDILSSALLAGTLALISLTYILGFNPLILVLAPLCAGLGGFGGWLGGQVRNLITNKGASTKLER